MIVQALIITLLGCLASARRVDITNNVIRNGIGPGVVHNSPHAREGSPAYRFDGRGRGICFDNTITKQVTGIMSTSCSNSSCFTISTQIRLEVKRFSGTLFSISSPSGGFLELFFMKSIQFRLRFSSDGVQREEAFFHGFKRNSWQHLVLAVCPKTGVVHVYLDCLKIFETTLPAMTCFQPTAATERFCIGERSNSGRPFLGSIQNMAFFSSSDEVNQLCPRTDTGSFWKAQYDSMVSGMAMQQRRVGVELQECQSELRRMRCTVSGVRYMNGSTVNLPCRNCMCLNGELSCSVTSTCPPKPPCPRGTVTTMPANFTANQCCPRYECIPSTVPPGGCDTSYGIFAPGGSIYRDSRNCTICTCMAGGRFECRATCSSDEVRRTCPSNMQYQGSQDCCVRCLTENFCANHHDCGLGQCKNFPTHSECVCNPFTSRMDTSTRACVALPQSVQDTDGFNWDV